MLIASVNQIRRVRPDGVIELVAGCGRGNFSGDAGPPREASLWRPKGRGRRRGGRDPGGRSHSRVLLTERILVNLLHNAVRHGAPPVRLRAVPSDGHVDLIVSDSGPGIDPARAASLFRTFVDPSGTGGLGVGLRLSDGLAAAQGADLRMVSTPRSACFALSLRSVPLS